MRKAIIKEGDRFGRLVAIRFDHRNKQSNQYWLFKCACGKKKVISVSHIKREKIKSCGCLQRELSKKRMTKHGMARTKIYKIWVGMKTRCLNKKDKTYRNYGRRGITICPEWLTFENFYTEMGDRPIVKTLDRIDNNGNYCKENCQWATIEEQNNNRRNNVFLTYKNKTQTIKQWARELGINYDTLWYRINRSNKSIKEALTFNI